MTRAGLLAAGLLLAACTPMNATAPTVSAGEWGGQDIDLMVSETGARVLFKCGAMGVVAQPLALDGSGRFATSGTYEPKLVQTGAVPAQFSGSVSGSQMTLTVQTGAVALGPFGLVQGQAGTFSPCNF
jgi:hypothetical protein